MDSWKRPHRFSFIILFHILMPSSNIIANGESGLTRYILYEASGRYPNGQGVQSAEYIESHLDGKTVVLIHDINQSPETALIRELKDALIEARNTNVILVNWTENAHESAGNIEEVVSDLKDFMEELVDEEKASVNNLHCIGVGFGAHICGLAGNPLRIRSGDRVLPRISGLNPTRFSSKKSPIRRELSSSDAEFVDIIQTSFYRTLKLMGDVDFHVNRFGREQPGCTNRTCSYERALQYYISSVRRACQFISKPCEYIGDYVTNKCKCSEDNYGQMGYDSPEAPGRGIQYVQTTDTEPFC